MSREWPLTVTGNDVMASASGSRARDILILLGSEVQSRLVMGCRMTVSQHVPDEYPEIPNLLSVPNEVLVKIMSFLPARDKVKLRYVSRKLLSISETPSLWHEFVWPDCNFREEKSLHTVMKACGVHIRRLSFPRRLIQPRIPPNVFSLPIVAQKMVRMSEMAKILQYCRSLTHLSLGDLGAHGYYPDKQLREAIQEMNNLEVLNICCYDSVEPYLNLKIALKELTIHAVIDSKNDIKSFQNWVTNGFNPQNLNIVLNGINRSSTMIRFREFLLSVWPRWNSQIQAGHVAYLRLYVSYKAPLNLFENVPVFQLRYGETATPPFVKASNFGVTDKWLLLTDKDGDGKKARLYLKPPPAICTNEYDFWRDNQIPLDNYTTKLTELDLSGHNIDFKQMVADCPQLRRLNLQSNSSLRIEDLQVIATCCYNLQGLNLMGILITDIKFCLKAWEILSSMRLTHLSMDPSFIGCSLTIHNVHKKQLIAFFKQCTTLRALNLSDCVPRIFSKGIGNYDYKLLSHFPSLEYCTLISYQEPCTCVEDILTTCKQLRIFCCVGSLQLSHLQVHNNLQQLCISCRDADLDDNFMDTVSVHGGLIHVALFIGSVTHKGITTLIRNSPNLLTFGIAIHEQKRRKEIHSISSSEWIGKRKFTGRKLFTSGLFLIQQSEGNEWLHN